MRHTTLKVASSQYPIGQPKTLAEWEEKVALWVKNGAATGAELLVFPEYAAIEQAACFGPEVYGDLQATLAKVADIKDARVQLHLDLAKKHNVHILVGSGLAETRTGVLSTRRSSSRLRGRSACKRSSS